MMCMRIAPQSLSAAIHSLLAELPMLQAVYLFGSEATGQATERSDIDLAVLLQVPLGAAQAWTLASGLAASLGREVDLVDLRSASTVMQHQVLCDGQRLWWMGRAADEFELQVFSQYWDLVIHRRGLLDDIKARGAVYGG